MALLLLLLLMRPSLWSSLPCCCCWKSEADCFVEEDEGEDGAILWFSSSTIKRRLEADTNYTQEK
jgi:hypothetical protein